MCKSLKGSSRVVDESNIAVAPVNLPEIQPEIGRNPWKSGFLSIFRAPLAVLACVSRHEGDFPGEFPASWPESRDGVWFSGEIPRISEMNYLMVRDSMRYAIFV
ncbi:uncharacterized protein LOC110008330 [Amborella trichopoda]|nr:uncharacterized protein LOC110008330 [Amborella trichopoda]|eukprot:XP_020530717.1 uncharacterized protein LOC110008330 [Amborella trichopoda]